MNANVESPSSSAADIIKWIAVVAILIAMVVANNMYGESSMLIRAVVFVIAVSACLGIASTTGKGQTFIAFAKESRTEIRRVIWPSRAEATQTTWIVGFATALTGVALWAIDGILMFVVGYVTGLRF